MQTMPATTIVIICLCLFLRLSSGVKHLVTDNNKEKFIVETKSDAKRTDYLDSYAGVDSMHQPEKYKSKPRTKTQQTKGIEYLVTTGSGSSYIVEFEDSESGKNSKKTVEDSKLNSQSKSNKSKSLYGSMRMNTSNQTGDVNHNQLETGVKNFTEFHFKRKEISSGGTLFKHPKSNASVVEEGQDYNNSPPDQDPESPDTNPEKVLEVKQAANPEVPSALTIDLLKPREDEHLFNHNIVAEGAENHEVGENNKTALGEDNSEHASNSERNKTSDFDEKHIALKGETQLSPNKNESKKDTFKEMKFESPFDKNNPNPIPMRPKDVEHGQDYGNSEPDNDPNSPLKANHLEGKEKKEIKTHK